MDRTDLVATLSQQLDEATPPLVALDAYYRGSQPLSFLAPEAAAALGNRLRTLSVNFARLAVDALAERLRVLGFRVDGAERPDPALWDVWTTNGLDEMAGVAMTEALTLGRSHVLVWAGTDPRIPRVTVESAYQTQTVRDPATGRLTAALKRWQAGGRAHALLLEPDRLTRLASESHVPAGGMVPSYGWTVTEVIPNPLGVVPLVTVANRGRLLEPDGVSEMTDLLGPVDLLGKLMSDLAVTSEFYSRPRRWVSGIELPEVEGEPDPATAFSQASAAVWMSEDPATKFGEFRAADLAGYEAAVRLVTAQIGALADLPAHMLGIHTDQPSSADAIRSAESGMTRKAEARQRTFGRAWAEVARLVIAVRDGTPADRHTVEVMWASPETSTPAMAADAAAKLVGAGIVPVEVALATLGYSPSEIEAMRGMRRRAALDGQGLDLSQLGAVTDGAA